MGTQILILFFAGFHIYKSVGDNRYHIRVAEDLIPE